MSGNKIKIVFEGVEDDGGHVDLRVFLGELKVIQSALLQIDKNVYDSKRAITRLLVSDLSHSSPTMLQVKPCYQGTGSDKTAEVISLFETTVDAIARGQIPKDADYHLLETLKLLGKSAGTKHANMTIVVDETDYDIREAFSQNVANVLKREESCWGSVEGALEQINVHGPSKHFTIYPEVGQNKVKCNFPEELHNDAINAIEKRVLVSGKLVFRPYTPFPHEVFAESLKVSASDDKLPTFDDLLGILPHEEEVQPAEKAIREIRDEWE